MNIFPCEYIEVIGQGCFAIVYKALTPTKELIALKIIQALNPGKRAMIKEEINVLESLDNPNIIKFLGGLEYENNYYLATELCEGGDLETYLQNNPAPARHQILFWVQEIIKALAYLEKMGKMHRDIKPANFFLTSKDPEKAHLKIGDFGFSKSIQNNLTGTRLGTPLYMAPELFDGDNYDYRADVWSLGCVIYELIEGSPIFDAGSISELIRLQKNPIRFSDRFSEDERNLVMMMVQNDYRKRPNFTELEELKFIRNIERIFSGNNELLIKNSVNYSNEVLKNINKGIEDIFMIFSLFESFFDKEYLYYFIISYLTKKLGEIKEITKELLAPLNPNTQYKLDYSENKLKSLICTSGIRLEEFQVTNGLIDTFINTLIPNLMFIEDNEKNKTLFIEMGLFFCSDNEILQDLNRNL